MKDSCLVIECAFEKREDDCVKLLFRFSSLWDYEWVYSFDGYWYVLARMFFVNEKRFGLFYYVLNGWTRTNLWGYYLNNWVERDFDVLNI